MKIENHHIKNDQGRGIVHPIRGWRTGSPYRLTSYNQWVNADSRRYAALTGYPYRWLLK